MKTPETQDTHARLAELTRSLEAQERTNRRRHGAFVCLVAALALVVGFGFSEVAALARNLDADTLAFMGRQQAEARLPEGRLALQEALRSQAPELVEQALESALDSVPSVRAMLVDQVNANLDRINAEFEQQTLVAIGEVILASRASVEQAYPEDAFVDREMLMAHAAAGQVKDVFAQALDQLYPTYAARMQELTGQVQYLAHTPPERLTSLQRKHREIIRTVLQLVSRAEDGQGF